jgi:hypothetical protein
MLGAFHHTSGCVVAQPLIASSSAPVKPAGTLIDGLFGEHPPERVDLRASETSP